MTATPVDDAVRALDPRSRIVAGVIARVAAASGDGAAQLTRAEIAAATGLSSAADRINYISKITAGLAASGLINIERAQDSFDLRKRYVPVDGLADATRCAVLVDGLNPSESWVLMHLREFSEIPSDAWPEQSALAAFFGIVERQYRRIVAKLERAGFIEVDRATNGKAIGYRMVVGE